jgi:hypothetical protein
MDTRTACGALGRKRPPLLPEEYAETVRRPGEAKCEIIAKTGNRVFVRIGIGVMRVTGFQ